MPTHRDATATALVMHSATDQWPQLVGGSNALAQRFNCVTIHQAKAMPAKKTGKSYPVRPASVAITA
jgi:hypothetical protein